MKKILIAYVMFAVGVLIGLATLSAKGQFTTNAPEAITIPGGTYSSFYDTATTNFSQRASLTNSARYKVAVDGLVRELKAASLWTNVFKAFYPFVGAKSYTSRYNLMSSSYTLTFAGTNTYDFYGVTSDNASGYADTGLAPNGVSGLATNAWSIYAWVGTTNPATIDGVIVGAQTDTNETYLSVTAAAPGRFYVLGTNGEAITITATNFQGGNIIGVCNPTMNFVMTDTELTNNATALPLTFLPGRSLYVNAHNDEGTAATFSGANLRSVAIGGALTTTQATNLFRIMNRFQAQLKREGL